MRSGVPPDAGKAQESLLEAVVVILVARQQGIDLGVHYGVIAGQRYNYLMGGTVRAQPDLGVGHFLHWMAINRAKDLGLMGYDLTSGGSSGVMRFKMGFGPSHVKFDSFVERPVRDGPWSARVSGREAPRAVGC